MKIKWEAIGNEADCCGDIYISAHDDVAVLIYDTLWCHWEDGYKTFDSLQKAIEGLMASFGDVRLTVTC